jgi:lipopolysaccharide export system permease protein
MPRNQYADAELQYRITWPIMCVVLMLLAIPLGFVNPRVGSSANLIWRLLIFFTYNNLTKLFDEQRQAEQTAASFRWPGGRCIWWWLLTVGLFAWRLNVNHRWHPAVLWSASSAAHAALFASRAQGEEVAR